MAESTAQIGERGLRKTVTGVVMAANKTPKTIVVKVQHQVRHAKYGKYLRWSSRLHAHDEQAQAKPGDQVELMECRPISRTKRWRLVKVVRSAPRD